MNRPGFERIKRRTHIRLSLEHLEHRRLMAGLNVLVFTDQDGSRSLSPAVDTPATNRLVYVDLNRDLTFDDGEPLAVSGEDGIARFSDLSPGDYLVGLAGSNVAQVLTTSVVPDTRARTVASVPGGALTSLIASPDLKHAWSATSGGVLTPVGADDGDRPVLNLNGRLLSVAGGSGTDSAAWVLVDQGLTQPSLYRLDYQSGSARLANVQGVPSNHRISGVVRSGDAVYLQLSNGDADSVAALQANTSGVSLGQTIAVPAGKIVGSSVANRLAVLGTRSQVSSPNSQLSGEEVAGGSKISLVQIRGASASIESIDLEDRVGNVSFSEDGQWLFAAWQGGGLKVFSTNGTLRAAAQLAEAAGPVSAGSDGRFITANASNPGELIVWETGNWTPTGRVQLPAGQGAVVSLAVDGFGDRVLAATSSAALSARLANPAPQSIAVSEGVAMVETTLGVRLVDRLVPLPTRIEVSEVADEDALLSFDLSSEPALRALGSGLVFAPVAGSAMGSLVVTPSGRVSYQGQQNVSGRDSATLRVFDGVNTTSLVIALDVRPVNDPPSAFTVDPISIDETAISGEVAGMATVFDVDSDARYEITTNDSRFYVVDGQVTLAANGVLDFETESTIELEITATDLDNPAFVITRRISIPVRDVNEAPTSIELSDVTVDENVDRASVGAVVVQDPDGQGDYAYSLSDDRFEIDGGQLRLRSGVMLDYEGEPVVALTITAMEWSVAGARKSVSADVTIQVMDNNDAPSKLTVSANELRAGEAGAIVGRVNVIDEDVGDEHKFWVSDSRFEVNGYVLRLRDGQSVSAEQESVISMMVTVSDRAGAVLSETVTLNVVNDSPFQNSRDPFDVDNDGSVYPRDAIILVNQLNQRGSHVLTPVSASGESSSTIYFLDVNGDGLLTPLDALLLINHINQQSAQAVNNGSGGMGNNGSGAQSHVEEDDEPDPDSTHSVAEGEGPLADDVMACQPLLPTSDVHEQAKRDAIDAELELLVDELSRARLS